MYECLVNDAGLLCLVNHFSGHWCNQTVKRMDHQRCKDLEQSLLVGGWTTQSEKYSNWIMSQKKRGVKINISLKLPPILLKNIHHPSTSWLYHLSSQIPQNIRSRRRSKRWQRESRAENARFSWAFFSDFHATLMANQNSQLTAVLYVTLV